MGRPSGPQWEPLGWDTDPVPGDPRVIEEEAKLLAAVTTQLDKQIAALRKIASDQTNVGHTPDKIRSAASGIVGSLEVVRDRYQRVSSALHGWVPELEHAQSMSLKALNQAEAPYTQLHQAVVLPSGSHLTAQQKQDIHNYQTAMKRAREQLGDAQVLLSRAINLRDTQASHYAGLINAASHDSLTDSWWNSFENWVDDNVGWLKEVKSILSDVVGIIGIICLFIPGVDLLVFAALALTAALLVIDTLLASTGNGGWLDVGLDLVSLVTMGMGADAAEGIEDAESTARELAEPAQEEELADALHGSVIQKALSAFRSQVDEDGRLTDIGRAGVQATYKAVIDMVPKLPEEEEELSFWAKTVQQFKTGLAASTDVLTKFGGDPAIKTAMDDLDTIKEGFSSVEGVTEAADSAAKILRGANTAFRIGAGLGTADFIASQIPGYNSWKDSISTYALNTTEADAALSGTGIPEFAMIKSLW